MKISVITITYNSGKYIDQCMESVLNQDFTDFEYLVCDDNSSDDTWSRIQQYNDPRIIAVKNETNLGEYANRNNAVKKSTGDYFIFIDGDDLMYPHALYVFNRYMHEFADCGLIFTRPWDPRIIYPFKLTPEQMYQFEYLDGGMMGGNFTNTLFRKSSVVDAGYFDPSVKTGDTHMQLKIGAKQPSLAIPEGLTWWRRRAGNATSLFFSGNKHMIETLTYRLKFLDASPLSEADKHLAKQNMYGLFLRTISRLMIRLKFADVAALLKAVPVPAAYWGAVFRPAKQNFFDFKNGDDPLQTKSTYSRK